MAKLMLKLHVAWWLKYYLHGVALMCAITGCDPNMERVSFWIGRGVKVRVA